jgi:uncharacterized OB-fold protein
VTDTIPFRSLPDSEGDAGWFWTAGAEGQLRILRCQSCKYWVHPPGEVCPRCLGRTLAPEAVSGEGALFSFAVNHHVADERVQVPYLVALVELPEQEGLRLISNLVDCDVDAATIGMPLKVKFEHHEGDTYIPVWVPA